MANSSITKRILGLSPHIEMVVRRLYWRNIEKFTARPKKKALTTNPEKIDFDKLSKFMKENGANEGRLMLVHSAFAPLKGRGKTANEVLDFLLNLVGSKGTLAMPAMPKFKNEIPVEEYLTFDTQGQVYHYDVSKSGIKTGVLPLMLHKRDTSIRSRFPINTMVASGPLAEELFKDEFELEDPLACGQNSSWHKCIENNALIVGLGTDLTHSLTAIHVVEDAFRESWPVKNWYITKEFRITDGEYEANLCLKERAPHWGALHFGERTLCKDLINAGILKSKIIDGVLVEVIESRELIEFLQSKKKSGYPYFWLGKNKTNE